MKHHATHLITAALVVPLLLAAAGTARADGFGPSVGDEGSGLSAGVGDWDAYGNAWNDPGWSVDFHASLDGYGQWMWVDGLGEVWTPNVAADWRPYTYGRWVYTEAGWTWVPYEPWGYFPHHYGEWALTDFGWVWVPGYTFRAANVVWVGFGDYVGWYPAAPTGWSHAHHGFWHGYQLGYDRGSGDGSWDGWQDARYATYVPWNNVDSDDVAHYAMDSRQVARSVTQATVRPMPAAPDRSDVVRRTGHEVAQVPLERREVRVDGHTVTITRPQGVSRSVADHAPETVRRALAPTAARRAETNLERARSATRTSTAPVGRSRTGLRTGEAPVPASADRGSLRDRTAIVPRAGRAAERPATVVGNRQPVQRQQPAAVAPGRTSHVAPHPSFSTGSSSPSLVSPERSSSTLPSTRRAPLYQRPSVGAPGRVTGDLSDRFETRMPVARGTRAGSPAVTDSQRFTPQRPALERPSQPQSAMPSRTLQRRAAPSVSSTQSQVTSQQSQAAPRVAAGRSAVPPAARSGQTTTTEPSGTRRTRKPQPGQQPAPPR